MTALTAPRPTPSLETGKNVWRTFPVAADAIIFPGAQVALNAGGYLVPATASTALVVIGVAVPKREQNTPLLGYINATGKANGAMECEVQSCIALMVNSSSTITIAEVGDDCYAVDDQTVAKSNGGTSQVSRGDVVYSTTDAVGVTVDGLTIDVPSNTSDDQTLADLIAKWNAHPVAKTVATATGDTSGAESWFILSFADTSVHTVVAYSPATADVVNIANTTAAVAATRSRAGRIHAVETRGVWVEYTAA